jgi:hypothetical protein
VILAILLLAAAGRVFDFAARRDLRSKPHWVIAQHGGAYDFAVMGTSRAYLGVNVTQLQRELGTHGINLAIDGAGYPEQFLALRLFARANHIENLILDLNAANLDTSSLTYPFHDYQYLPYEGDQLVDSALHEQFGLRADVWKYVPFWRNAEFNSKIGPLQLYTLVKGKIDPRALVPEFDATGSRPLPRPFHLRSEMQGVRWHPEASQCLALQKMIDFAKGQGIRVTLTVSPEWQPWTRVQENRSDVIDYFRYLAAINDLPILIFDDLPFLADTTYFLEWNHLNAKGAELYSHALAERLGRLWRPAKS